jgi:hypothetical protein
MIIIIIAYLINDVSLETPNTLILEREIRIGHFRSL